MIPIVDRVGGGDAFNSIIGDFNAVTMGEVEALMAGDASGRVSR